MKRILGLLEVVFITAGIALAAAMFVCVFLQVFTRYVLLSPLSWTEEVARYVFVWASFLGAAVLVGRGEHFSIDLIVRALRPKWQSILAIAVGALVMTFAMLMTVYGLRVSLRLLTATSPVLELSLGLVYSIIPISGVYMLLCQGMRVLTLLKKLK